MKIAKTGNSDLMPRPPYSRAQKKPFYIHAKYQTPVFRITVTFALLHTCQLNTTLNIQDFSNWLSALEVCSNKFFMKNSLIARLLEECVQGKTLRQHSPHITLHVVLDEIETIFDSRFHILSTGNFSVNHAISRNRSHDQRYYPVLAKNLVNLSVSIVGFSVRLQIFGYK